MSEKVVATNRKARFEYFILESFEAGISLQGSEIKSIRAGQMSLGEAYVKIEDGKEAWLVGAHISPYDPASRYNHNPTRSRRLLLNKREIRKIWNEVRMKGVTVIPLRVYLTGSRRSRSALRRARSSTTSAMTSPSAIPNAPVSAGRIDRHGL